MREIPSKNYIILSLMTIGVIIVCLIFNKVYKFSNNKNYSSIMRDFISEIQYEDLDNYLLENLDVVLYINDNSTKNDQNLEKELKKIITNNGISQYVVYIEKSEDIIKKYDLDSNSPIFIAYQNGIVTEILSKPYYTSEEIQKFLVRNKVIDND